MKGREPDLSRLVEAAKDSDPRTLLVTAAALLAQAVAILAHAHKQEGLVAVDVLLTAVEAARLANVSTRWLYEHARELPFARRIGRLVRFSRAGLIGWLETRGR